MAKDVMEVLERMRTMDPFTTNAEQDDALKRVAELIAASPDMAALFRAKWGNLDPDANAVYERFVAALAACRGL